jgi:hypothetical protein
VHAERRTVWTVCRLQWVLKEVNKLFVSGVSMNV